MARATLIPTDFDRRSFVGRILAAEGAVFAEIAGSAVAEHFGDPGSEIEAARKLGLADLSPLSRTGFKGRGALDWLKTQSIAGLDENNRGSAQDDGSLALRLAPSEAVILGSLAGEDETCARLDGAWSAETAPNCYPVMRRDASFWFVVTGSDAAAMFAKICGVDLRPHKFAPLAIAQTSVARTNAIVTRQDLGSTLAFHVLGDSASAEFFWGCVIDAMAEFGGRPVGLAALRALVDSKSGVDKT